MTSLYASRFDYALSDPLKLSFLLGVQNSRFGTSGTLNQGGGSAVLGGVALNWTPAANVLFHLEMLGVPAYSAPAGLSSHLGAFPSR